MNMFFKAAMLGVSSIATVSVASVPAAAQSKLGVAVVSLDRAVAGSAAYQAAQTQMRTTYKANIDSFNARQTALDTDLKAKQAALQTAAQAAGQTPTAAQTQQLQTQYAALQKSGQDAREELQRLGQPLARAQAYVEEQIVAKLSDALKAAMTQMKVDLVLKEAAAESFMPSVDITSAVTAQLNTMVPSVSIVPPAGWQPGGQQAAPGAAAPAATTPPPAANKPTGR